MQETFAGRRKLVFVWIPKTAGTTLFESLRQTLGMQKLKQVSQLPTPEQLPNCVTFGHMSIDALLAERYMLQSYQREAFFFAFVRNPWDRFVSLFHYQQLHKEQGLSFPLFVRSLHSAFPSLPALNCSNGAKWQLPLCGHSRTVTLPNAQQWLPQVSWIPKGGLDFCGRFECLEEEVQRLEATLNIKIVHQAKLERLNHSQRSRNYRPYFDDETRELVRQMYAADIDQFAYEF